MKYDIMIGIDPDVHRSGVAIKRGDKLEVQTLTFFALFDALKAIYANEYLVKSIIIRIEAGWLNEKSNFHGRYGQSKSAGERIAKNVGANHETGRKIAEMCDYIGLPYELIRPQSAKWTPAYFKAITGIETKNQEKIDAARLIL